MREQNEPDPPDTPRCTALGATGQPCRARPLIDQPYCFQHGAPPAARLAAHQKGGHAAARKRAQADAPLADLAAAIEAATTSAEMGAVARQIAAAVVAGRLSPRHGAVATQAVNAALKAGAKHLDERLDALEQHLAEQQPDHKRRRR